jgi:predicted PurR-regulated permease PerM
MKDAEMDALKRTVAWMFGPALAAYLVRGAMAVALFMLGYSYFSDSKALGMAVMFSALIPLGGCPSCWLGGTIGAACAYLPQKDSAAKK